MEDEYHVTVRMVRPYHDSFLYKPSRDDVLEALADMIKAKAIDDLFVVDVFEGSEWLAEQAFEADES